MTNALPMTLRVYRKLSSAMVPLAPALIKRRLKQGKEDPARIGERRGLSDDIRPHGPLVWIHGASVGEVLAAAALIEKLRALNLRILLTSGTVTSAAIVAKRFPADIIHQYVPYDSPRYVARFLDHWRPSLALFIESDLWPNLILSSAARRLPMVLINGRMSQRSFPRWSRMSGTISALLGKFEVCLAQSDARRGTLCRARQPQRRHHGQPETGRAGAARRPRQARAADVGDARPPGHRRGLDPSRRGGNPARSAPDAGRILSVAADRDRAAASRSRRGDRPHRSRLSGLHAGLRSREELPTAATDIYVADTMGELGLFYRLAPIVFMGGSLVAHGGQNPIEAVKLGASIVHGPHVFNFTDVYEALDRAGGARRADTQGSAGEATRPVAGRSGGARRARWRPRRSVVEQLGGALGAHAHSARTLSAAVAARNGSGQCVSRPSGTGPRH